MLDFFNIPNSQQDVKVFYTNGTVNAWQTWQKPRKCNYVYIICIGGGGGGGGGQSVNVQLPYSTGGSSGGVSRTLYNSQQIPDTLYVQVGTGGAGGAASTFGTAGTRSFVSLQPSIGSTISIAGSGTAGAAGGTSGSGGTAVGEPAATQTNINFLTLSTFLNTSGVNAIGNAGLVTAPDLTPLTSQIVSAGAGGPGWNTTTVSGINGASILSTSFSPLISGGTLATGTGNNAGNGADGITSWKPFFSTGGAGGGSASGGNGGNGGNGGIGSGGGGGGGCPLANVAGRGGRGGDGLVIIISF
jgi:hypothetical protein